MADLFSEDPPEEVEEIHEPVEGEFSLFGENLFGEKIQPEGRGPLAERFEFPPFSVLNAREGQWQDRKRAWLSTGIQSELGRADGVTWGDGAGRPIEKLDGLTFRSTGFMAAEMAARGGGTSIFDPVL